MPQLDVSTYLPQLFWLAVSFIVLYVLMSTIALPRIAAAIEARRRRREEDLDRAAQLRRDAEALVAAYESARAAARDRRALGRGGGRAAAPVDRGAGRTHRCRRTRHRRRQGPGACRNSHRRRRCRGRSCRAADRGPS